MTLADLAGATIVFDLDGTLVDTAPDLVRALNQTLDLEGLPRVPAASVRKLVGQGARALIERGAALADVRFSPDRLDQLTNEFITFYKADIAAESTPFPGALEALDELAQAGAILAVCTNKRSDLSRQLLEALSLHERFAAIVGADSVANRKPHPDHFREAVARAGGVVMRALMVGDSSADVKSAQAAGAPAILCSFGYADGAPEEMGADAIVAHYDELSAAARRLLAPRS
ncbi:MAG: phosphoglycolate phosphatase [Hyphomonadaceae bacterium]